MPADLAPGLRLLGGGFNSLRGHSVWYDGAMASKTTKKANAAVKKGNNAPAPKDDGTRWIIMRDGRQVYPGPGVTRAQAQHLAGGLLEPAEIVQVTPS